MFKFSVVMFKSLWASKSRKRGYDDDAQPIQPVTTVEVNASLTSFDLTTPYSSEDYPPWNGSSPPRKRLFQEFNTTDLNASSQSRTNWNVNWGGQACNDEHPIIDPDDICTGVGLGTNDETFNLGFHNNLDNIATSGWKELPESQVHVKTRNADLDMKQSLGVEATMVQCSVRKTLNIDVHRQPTSKELFQFFWGEKCALTKILMRAAGISYVELLIFLNTFCILIVFGMSLCTLVAFRSFLIQH